MAGNVVSNVKKYYGGQVPVPGQGDSDGKVKVLVEKTATIEIGGVQTEVELLYDADDLTTPVTPQQLGQWTDENYLIAFKKREDDGRVRGFVLYALDTDSTSTDTLVNRAEFIAFKEDMTHEPGASAYEFTMVEDSSTLSRYLRDENGELIVKFDKASVEEGAQSDTLANLIGSDSKYMRFEVVREDDNAYLNLNTESLDEEIEYIQEDINYLVGAIGELPSDEHGYFNSSLVQTPGDGTTTNIVIDDFRIAEGRDVNGENIEFVPTRQEGGVDFGNVYLNPGTYIFTVHYTLQWVGNPRGTFLPLVANVGDRPFDFSYEHEDVVRTTRIVTRTSRGKFSLGFPIDADTPAMGIWVKNLEIAQIASYNHPAVAHDTTLTGKGQLGDPLGVTPAAFGKVKDIPTSINQFRTGDVIPVDGPNGPAKMAGENIGLSSSINLFDKSTVLHDRYLASGVPSYISGFFTSDFIPVIGGRTIKIIHGFITCWYDAQKQLISQIGDFLYAEAPSNAAFLRTCARDEFLDTLQVGYNVNSDYRSFTDRQINDFVDSSKLLNFPKLTRPNIIELDSASDGMYLNPDGSIGYNSNFVLTAFLPVSSGYVTTANVFNFATYNASRQLVRFSWYASMKLNSDEVYIRITIQKNPNLTKAVVCDGIAVPTLRAEAGPAISGLSGCEATYESYDVPVGANLAFETINDALTAITDASEKLRYRIVIEPGVYNETFHTKDYVDVIGKDRYKCKIAYVSDNESDYVNRSTIFATSNTLLKNLTITTKGTKYPIHSDGAFGAEYHLGIENCTVEHLGFTGSQVAGTGIGIGLNHWQHITIKNCDVRGSGAAGCAAIYCHNSNPVNEAGASFRSLKLEGVKLNNATYGLRLQAIESTLTWQQSNECLLRDIVSDATTPIQYEYQYADSWIIENYSNYNVT